MRQGSVFLPVLFNAMVDENANTAEQKDRTKRARTECVDLGETWEGNREGTK
jgi:hypothetical protein